MSISNIKLTQRALRETVAPTITVDGIAGNQTEKAIELYCTTFGVNKEAASALLLRYANLRYVSDDAFTTAAGILNVKESYVRALAEVETMGESFLKDGRVKILFERHWFYKKLKQALDTSQAVRLNVARLLKTTTTNSAELFDQVTKKYSSICNVSAGGYLGNEKEWTRIETAMDLDIDSACQSASYGGYQLMGFNYAACGYTSAKAMLLDLAVSESQQFVAAVKFIKANPSMLAAFKRGDFATFASMYNGSNYKINAYDTKLAAAVIKWDNEAKK